MSSVWNRNIALASVSRIEVIRRGLSANLSYAKIAQQIGRPTTTVSREAKNNDGRYAYRCCPAQRKAHKLTFGPKASR